MAAKFDEHGRLVQMTGGEIKDLTLWGLRQRWMRSAIHSAFGIPISELSSSIIQDPNWEGFCFMSDRLEEQAIAAVYLGSDDPNVLWRKLEECGEGIYLYDDLTLIGMMGFHKTNYPGWMLAKGTIREEVADEMQSLQEELKHAQSEVVRLEQMTSAARERVFKLRHQLSLLALASPPQPDPAESLQEFDLFEE